MCLFLFPKEHAQTASEVVCTSLAKPNVAENYSVVTCAKKLAPKTARHARKNVQTVVCTVHVQRNVANLALPVQCLVHGSASTTHVRSFAVSRVIDHDVTSVVRRLYIVAIPVSACVANLAQRNAEFVTRMKLRR